MLLYGPPGTGKTSFAEALAEALNYDLIIVSPSDFIRSGEAGVEERAKRVFDVLLAQSDTVILFDEIDRLLLNRASAEYARQGDMFQFMTPSMLTKINDLRTEQRSIFVVATNYAERIDSAIKRPGRIDEQILLLPPDLAQRIAIIGERVGAIKKLAEKAGITADPLLDETQIESLARQTPLYIYSELKYLVQSIANRVKKGSTLGDAMASAVEQYSSTTTISLKSYYARFHDEKGKPIDDPGSSPWKEIALLAYLKAQVGQLDIPEWATKVLNHPEVLPEVRKLGNDLLVVLDPLLDKP